MQTDMQHTKTFPEKKKNLSNKASFINFHSPEHGLLASRMEFLCVFYI